MEVALKQLSVVVALALVPSLAFADSGVRVGIDLENGFPTDGALPLGPGFNIDLGYKLGFGIGRLIPEVSVGYAPRNRVVATRAGGAIFLGKMIEGGAYMHAVLPFAPTFSSGAVGFDAGLALDVTAVPHLDFGLHFGGQFIGDTDETVQSPDQEYVLGVHAGFTL
jgi:hypothetical protein